MSYFRTSFEGLAAPAPATACPVPVGTRTTDRCQTGHACPAIPDLLCARGVAGLPFEYVFGTRIDPATRLHVVERRQENRLQRFRPSVRQALERFVADMARFGMPIEAILTMGSLYCRCISNTDRLSDHSFGEAIDIPGVRWRRPGGSPSRQRETLIHNVRDPAEGVLVRRINACLRLAFPRVIDYHRRDHWNHFHCDMNRGRGRDHGVSTWRFAQEMLGAISGRPLAVNGRFNAATRTALAAFVGVAPTALSQTAARDQALDRLFTHVASGAGAGVVAPPAPGPARPVAPPRPAAPTAPGRPDLGAEVRMVRDALARGVQGLNRLTNLVFHARHPELNGRSIQPGEAALAREWLEVRDRVVAPTLAAAGGRPGRTPAAAGGP